MGDRVRRLTLRVGVVAYLGGLLLTALLAPDTVPQHIAADGEVTAWSSKTSHLLVMAGLGAFLVLVTLGTRALVSRVDASWINLPDRAAHAYWTSPEHRPAFNRRIRADIDVLMGLTCMLVALLMTLMAVVSGPAGSAHPANTVSFILVGVYTVAVIGYCISLMVGDRYAVPDEA